MKNSVIAIQSFVMTTIVYTLLAPIFFEIDNIFGEGKYFVVDDNNNESDKTMTSNTQQKVETSCKSPCPSTAEMCIEVCA